MLVIFSINLFKMLDGMDIPYFKERLLRVDPVIPDLVSVQYMAEQLSRLLRYGAGVFIEEFRQFLVEMVVVFKQIAKKRFHGI